jgi:hypothetical protein
LEVEQHIAIAIATGSNTMDADKTLKIREAAIRAAMKR